jgi:hypothetical protein
MSRLAYNQGAAMGLADCAPGLQPILPTVWGSVVREIVQAAMWTIHAERLVLQFPVGRRRPQAAFLRVSELAQSSEFFRKWSLEKTISRQDGAGRHCTGDFSFNSGQKNRATHGVFVPDPFEPGGH